MDNQIPSKLEEFIEHLMQEKGMTNLEPEVEQQVKKDLNERINGMIVASILEQMPKDKLEEFEQLLDEGDPLKIQAFNEQNVSNLQEVVSEALIKFKKAYLGIA